MVIVIVGAPGLAARTIGQSLADNLGWPYLEGDRLAPIIARVLGRRDHAIVGTQGLTALDRETLAGDFRPVRFVYLRASPAAPREADDPLGPLSLDPALPRDELFRAIRYEFGL